MKRMRCADRVLLLLLTSLSALSGCIYQTLPECPPSLWLAPEFTLHTETDTDGTHKDMFGQTAQQITVYFFDAEGRFAGQFSERGPFRNGYRIECPLTEAGDYHAVLWVNEESATRLNVKPMPGVTTLKELQLSLKEIDSCVITQQFGPILHGKSDRFTITGNQEESRMIPVGFMRATHQVQVTARWRNKHSKELCDASFHAEKTRMYIKDENGIVDFENELRPCKPLTYVPRYFSGEELKPYKDPVHPNAATLAGQFSVMRLLTDSKTKLIFTTVKEDGSEETITEYHLLEWIKATKAFDTQEDLDRPETFQVYLEFLCDDASAGEDTWVAVNITINGWRISNMDGEDL